MDYLRTIKLGHGKGKPGIQACWMTALQAHLGGEWTDQCDCVDPVINKLCIRINDIYGSDDISRTEDILEFRFFAPLGTQGTIEDSQRRLFKLVDVAVRVWTPYRLRLNKEEELAIKLEQLSPIVDKETAKTAHSAWATAAAAYAAVDAYYAVAAAADIAAPAAATAATAAAAATNEFKYKGKNYAAAYTAGAAAYAANAAANAAANTANAAARAAANTANAAVAANAAYAAAKRQFLKEYVFPVLRELIEMGPKASKEPDFPVCGVQKFQELVGIST
jgi:hypothetical protein